MVETVRAHWRLSAIFLIFSVGLLILHAVLGTPEGNSYKFNLPWFEGFNAAFWGGDLYPRYLFNLWYGLGAADFYFYGPLPFWLASTLGQATCPTFTFTDRCPSGSPRRLAKPPARLAVQVRCFRSRVPG